MFYFLVLIGPIAVAGGVVLAGLSIPNRESPLGAALLVAASVAMTGGFVLVGLAAALRELRGVAQALRALKARAPGTPRPSRPVERWPEERWPPEERRDGVDRWPAPVRPPVSGRPGITPPADFKPIDLDTPPASAAPVRDSAPEWLARAMAETSRPPAGAHTPGRDNPYVPAGPAAPPSAAERRPAATPEIWPQIQTPAPHAMPKAIAPEPRSEPLGVPKATAPDPRSEPLGVPKATAPEPRPEPLVTPKPTTPEALGSHPDLLDLQHKIFETMWPASRRRHDTGEGKPQEAPAEAPERTAAAVPIAPELPAFDPEPEQDLEPELPMILKSGVIEEMAYTLYKDGSITARMPDGTLRFDSIDELRSYLESREA